MSNMQIFRETVEKHLETLQLYVPIVARVHGAEHPEFHEVKKQYDAIFEKLNTAGDDAPDLPDLKDEFVALRAVTQGYKVPADTCESYEAVYAMLAELDQAYSR
jgi:iron-sulfur cluster repair protein YtfE (RIC family)